MRPDINRYKQRTDYTRTVRARPVAAEPVAALPKTLPTLPKSSKKARFKVERASLAKAGVLVAAIIVTALVSSPGSKPKSQVGSANLAQPQQALSVNTSSTASQTPVSPQSSVAASSAASVTPPKPSTTTSSPSTKASFTPVAPATKPQLGQYAFAQTSYDSSTGIYTYIDTLDGKPFSVSQQAIPSSYTTQQAAVDQVAASINAKQTISVPAGTGYMYVNPQNGQQTIVFALFGVFLSINSNFTHSTSDWQSYINSLH